MSFTLAFGSLGCLNSLLKVTRRFQSGFSLFLSLPTQSSLWKRSDNLPTALRFIFFLTSRLIHPFYRVGREIRQNSIRKGAVNNSTHCSIPNNLLPLFFSAFDKHLKICRENVLHSCSAKLLLRIHEFSTKPLTKDAPFHFFMSAILLRCPKPRLVER